MEESKQQQNFKFIALVSGGKDSIFNIVKCIENGHELVAIANLYQQNEGMEKDSYMYQSVGSNVTQYIADAMEKPIIRRQIKGSPVIQDFQYSGSEQEKTNDEVEDLFLLLKEAKEKYPEIQAVSSGAIASTYQKLRVENICNRLGLISLAYLWNRNQAELVKEMIDYGMHSILIKIASFGLKSKHLGKTIKENYNEFLELNQQHGFNIAGEGGEYETLTIDCPLYKKKLKIIESEIIKHSEDKFAPVEYFIIKKVELEEKQ